MTDTGREELQRSLALAKSGLRAPAAARERVRARLAADAVTPAVTARLARAPGQAFVRAALWLGVGVGVGYWLGFHRVGASLGESVSDRDRAPSVAFVTPSGAATNTAPSEAASSEAAPAEAPSSGPAEAGSSEAAAASPAAASPAAVAAPASTRRSASALPPARRRPEPRSVSTLGAEVALLERAERAIRAGEGELALALLDEVDQKFPVSPLREERAAARVLATCVNTRSSAGEALASAQAVARRFVANGSSLYAERVRQVCALAVPNANPGSQEPSDPGH